MINDIINKIRSSKHVLLAAHENPDGDAVGSLVGMANLCVGLNVPYTIIIEKVPEEYVFLTEHVQMSEHFEGVYETFIALDCGDLERLKEAKKYFEKAEITINIDHHETNPYFAHFNYVEKHASSTSELVFNLIEAAGISLNNEAARAIYAGIVTDTGGFMHSSTRPSTHIAASKLLQIPFDFTAVYYQLIHQKTETTIKLQAVAIYHLTKLFQQKVFLSYLSEEDLETHGATREDASSIVSYIKNIKGCEVAAFIYPSSKLGCYKLSLRANAPYNVAEIAALFGGGGHKRASGATIEGDLEAVINKIKDGLAHLKF